MEDARPRQLAGAQAEERIPGFLRRERPHLLDARRRQPLPGTRQQLEVDFGTPRQRCEIDAVPRKDVLQRSQRHRERGR